MVPNSWGTKRFGEIKVVVVCNGMQGYVSIDNAV